MQPETYLLRFIRTEAKTPTRPVNPDISLSFFPHSEAGEKKEKYRLNPDGVLSYHLLF